MLYNFNSNDIVRCFSTELHENDYKIDFQGGKLHGILVIGEEKTKTQYYTTIPHGNEAKLTKSIVIMAFKKLLKVDLKLFTEAFEMLKQCNPEYYNAVFNAVYKENFWFNKYHKNGVLLW